MLDRLTWAGLLVLLGPSAASAQETSPAAQVAEATLAAPESMRAGAAVLGYGGELRDGDALTLLRPGTNELICLADDPAREGFHVACYHRDLDDYMALGRRLRAAGGERDEIMEARYQALETGLISMPSRAALYSVTAPAHPDPETGELEGERKLVVVYVPGATGRELGLPTRPDGDIPWLMLPGTPWAHIMISR